MEVPSLLTKNEVSCQVNKANKEIKKKCKLTSKNKINYDTIFEIVSPKLLIQAFPENSDLKYENSFTLEDIQKVKLFLPYDNIEECLDEIFQGLNIDTNIIIEENERIDIIVPLHNKKFNEIKFELKKAECSLEDKLKFLNELKSENRLLRQEINNLKEEFNGKLEKETNSLKEEIKDLKQKIEEIKGINYNIGNKQTFSCIKYENHPCLLLLVDYKNKSKEYDNSAGYCCDECKKSFEKQIPCYYCPICNYDLCLECYGKIQVK